MSTVVVGQPAPLFDALSASGENLHLSSLKGKNVVLYFYPKDNTPVCTIEGIDFRNKFSDFEKQNTIIIGVSRDNILCHQKFKERFKLPFELITDKEGALCDLYNVPEKKFLGFFPIGIERATFLIDKEGILRHEWRNVRVFGHAEAVLTALINFDK